MLATGGGAAEIWKARDREREEDESCHLLCGRLVRDGGALDREAKELDVLLTATESPLGSASLFDVPRDLRTNRALGLNANASFNVRLTRRLNKRSCYFGLVRAFDSGEEAVGDE